mmetsp:Transcript_74997/g.231653  ORF Transcript_74997/g.231653 Transcript_74997/m.231653 type:complete len:295 (+) Transcript_74997:531-1415(+)
MRLQTSQEISLTGPSRFGRSAVASSGKCSSISVSGARFWPRKPTSYALSGCCTSSRSCSRHTYPGSCLSGHSAGGPPPQGRPASSTCAYEPSHAVGAASARRPAAATAAPPPPPLTPRAPRPGTLSPKRPFRAEAARGVSSESLGDLDRRKGCGALAEAPCAGGRAVSLAAPARRRCSGTFTQAAGLQSSGRTGAGAVSRSPHRESGMRSGRRLKKERPCSAVARDASDTICTSSGGADDGVCRHIADVASPIRAKSGASNTNSRGRGPSRLSTSTRRCPALSFWPLTAMSTRP